MLTGVVRSSLMSRPTRAWGRERRDLPGCENRHRMDRWMVRRTLATGNGGQLRRKMRRGHCRHRREVFASFSGRNIFRVVVLRHVMSWSR